MRYRLPLELELTILELAAPPLFKHRLVERVNFFIKISLVHRSLTAWAQERLHDQFLYTYRPREGEYARLERRLTEAGFGPSRPINRLYLDATRLCRPGNPEADAFDSEEDSETAATTETAASASVSSQSSEVQSETTNSGHAVFESAGSEWTFSPLLASCIPLLATLWLMLPDACVLDLSIISARHLLDVDHLHTMRSALRDLPCAQHTTLALRKSILALSPRDLCPTLSLVLDACVVHGYLDCFPELEVLIARETLVVHPPGYGWLPSTVRHVHILHRNFEDVDRRPVSAATFPALESLTFTWLQPGPGESGNPAADVADPLPDLRKFVESSVVAPQCTFKYLRSTKSSEEALADAMADLGLDS